MTRRHSKGIIIFALERLADVAMDSLLTDPKKTQYSPLLCADVDECSLGSHNCDPVGADCINTEGSFECECRLGFRDAANFTTPGVECPDVDECFENSYDCFVRARCDNVVGSFTCTCIKGMEGDGLACEHASEVNIEYLWPAGVKVGIFFSWHLKVEPHPQDLVTIDVVPTEAPADWQGKADGRNLQVFWLFTGAVGCSSQMTVAVGSVGTGQY
jgi:hypothetical protein